MHFEALCELIVSEIRVNLVLLMYNYFNFVYKSLAGNVPNAKGRSWPASVAAKEIGTKKSPLFVCYIIYEFICYIYITLRCWLKW